MALGARNFKLIALVAAALVILSFIVIIYTGSKQTKDPTTSNECGDGVCNYPNVCYGPPDNPCGKVGNESCSNCPADCGACPSDICANFGKNETEPTDWCAENSVWAYNSHRYLTTVECESPHLCYLNTAYPCYSNAAGGPYYQIYGKVVMHPDGSYTPVFLYQDEHSVSGEIVCMAYLFGACTKTSTGALCLPVYYYFTNSSTEEHLFMGGREVDLSELDLSSRFASGGQGVNIIGA